MEFVGVSSIATAPGKAILFGEHAVVYEKTAVAASLSDLRIKVDTVNMSCPRYTYLSCNNGYHCGFAAH
jgi:mevalonate kinase